MAAGLALPRLTQAQATPVASPATGEWTYTDVIGTTIALPTRPTRIAAYVNNAASLWDFGIKAQTVFGWTASHFPEGDHIAWGNIDISEIDIISDSDGNVELEKLVAANPELIVTWTWNKDDVASATNGFPIDVLDRVRQIAPIVILNQGDPDDIELTRVEALAEALGADMNAPQLVADREALTAKLAEVEIVATEKADLAVMFASYGDPAIIYVASPDYVADVGYIRSLGITLANDGSPTATAYWENLSAEQALKYPADVIYLDAYGAWNTLEAVQAEPTLNVVPAIASGQVGYWHRDFPLSYTGLTGFLEDILAPLRTAEKVS
jgi:iron complex transport system substrate-binding protein